MTTLSSVRCPPLVSIAPVSTQPGGGVVVNLELAWGQLRRWLLRRLWPGYVRDMASKRQGECPNCPHDILDARDLKYTRNVCGYWFQPEDDRYRWRDRIPFARPGLAELILTSLLLVPLLALFGVGAILVHPLLWLPFVAAGLFWAEVIYFFRDPERVIPSDPDALLSPADGTITRVDEIDDPDFPGGRAFRVSLFLSIFNVHVNRVPRSGRILAIRYFPGQFLDARRSECETQNEQLWVDLEDAQTGQFLRVKQIAGALARRIVCQLRLGEVVRAGDRYGMIKFGSRTDVLLPIDASIEVCVKVGDKVKGGSSVLLRFKK